MPIRPVHSLHSSTGRRASRAASLCASLAMLAAPSVHGAATIVFLGGQPGVSHYDSAGAELQPDTGFMFSLGSFYGGFEPTAENTSEWVENWVPVTTSEGSVAPGALAPLTEMDSIFGSFTGFSGSIDLDHNNAPFEPGAQGFIWGFDRLSGGGDAEWILLTNSAEWSFPSVGGGISLSETWTVEDADIDDMVVGSVEDGSMRTASVSLGGAAVPEPRAAILAAAGCVTLLLRRRR